MKELKCFVTCLINTLAMAAVMVMVTILIYIFYVKDPIKIEKQSKEIDRIVEYLAEDTEDPGNYVIAVYPAESRFAEYPDAKFYFAEMIDDDGDYERLVVIVKDGEIYDVGIYE